MLKKHQLMVAGATLVAISGLAAPSLVAINADNQDNTVNAKEASDTKNGLKVTPNAGTVNAAVKDAQAAGVDVTTKLATNTFSIDDAAKSKQVIEQDYAAQVQKIQAVTADYKQKMAQYQKEKAEYEATANKIPQNQDNTNSSGLNVNGGVSKSGDWRFMMTGSRDNVRNSALTVVANKNMSAKEAEHHYLKKERLLVGMIEQK